jgi:beta-lactamase regulating signal transducer with metallopeptidase domain
MIADLLLALLRINLAAGAAILVVLALRVPARRWLGAEVACAAWALVPVASAASLLPGPAGAPVAGLAASGTAWLSAERHAAWLAVAWAGGFLASAALTVCRQARFAAAARAGCAGPAVAGVIVPRLVVPADYADLFTAEERRLIRAHERAHIARKDLGCNALALVATWVCWFNPLAHVALQALRVDQDLACDAVVLRREPAARRAYAEALLRAQTSGSGPLASGWRTARHPLEARLRALMRRPPGQRARDLGAMGLTGLALAVFAAAWIAGPPARPTAPQETVILMDLQPPTPALVAWADRALAQEP